MYATVHRVIQRKSAVMIPEVKNGDHPLSCWGVIFNMKRERRNGRTMIKVNPESAATVDAGEGHIKSRTNELSTGFIMVLTTDARTAVALLIHHTFSLGGCISHFSLNLKENLFTISPT